MTTVEIGLATGDEFDRLAARLETLVVKERLSSWCVVVVRFPTASQEVLAALYGVTPAGRRWLTSQVLGVDLGRRVVKTKGGFYGLAGDPARPDTDAQQLIARVLLDDVMPGFVRVTSSH